MTRLTGLAHKRAAAKADFKISESFQYTDAPPFPFDITALGGLMDVTVTKQELIAWKSHTTGNFVYQLFPGDHFFIKTFQTSILQLITDIVMRYVR